MYRSRIKDLFALAHRSLHAHGFPEKGVTRKDHTHVTSKCTTVFGVHVQHAFLNTRTTKKKLAPLGTYAHPNTLTSTTTHGTHTQSNTHTCTHTYTSTHTHTSTKSRYACTQLHTHAPRTNLSLISRLFRFSVKLLPHRPFTRTIAPSANSHHAGLLDPLALLTRLSAGHLFHLPSLFGHG